MIDLLATHYNYLVVVALIASAGLLFNAVSGFCGLNAALGIDTADE